MSLKHKTYSAVRWTAASALVRVSVQIVQIAILARLLVPEDFGLMAMVGVVLSLAGLFSDLGVNSAFVHHRDVTREQRSSLFWFNVALGAGISLLLVMMSPLLARMLGDERLTLLMMLSAPTFVLSSLGQQIRLAAEKELDFRAVAMTEVVSAVLGFISALAGAFSGLGVYSLVLGAVVAAASSTQFAWMFVARGWRPMWRLHAEEVRPFLGFGGAMVANSIVNQVNSTLDVFLGGRILGAAQLGIYTIPRNLVLQLQSVVNPIVTRVGFPLIAKVQHDTARVRHVYLKTVNMISSANAPLYVGLALFAPDLVTVLLGNKWHGAAPLLRILAMWGFMRSLLNPVGSLLFGMGRADLALKWNTAMLLYFPPAIWIGAESGPAGLAWVLLMLGVIMYVPGWYFLVRPLCQADMAEYSLAQLRPLLLAVISIAPAYLIASQLDGAIFRLAVAVLISAPLYLLISYKFNRDWVASLHELLRRKPSSVQEL